MAAVPLTFSNVLNVSRHGGPCDLFSSLSLVLRLHGFVHTQRLTLLMRPKCILTSRISWNDMTDIWNIIDYLLELDVFALERFNCRSIHAHWLPVTVVLSLLASRASNRLFPFQMHAKCANSPSFIVIITMNSSNNSAFRRRASNSASLRWNPIDGSSAWSPTTWLWWTCSTERKWLVDRWQLKRL